MIAYGAAVGDWYRFASNMAQRAHGQLVMALYGQPSMAVAVNTILDAHKGKGHDALVLVHDDLEITDPLFEHKVLSALMGQDVALVGVAGGGPQLRWWEHDPIGHQMTDSGMVDFGRRTGDVDMLEGSVIAFSPWAVEHLRVDERYTDFRSGWDDVCLHAKQAGRRCVVVDADTHHHSTLGWKSRDVEARFVESERIFAEKWGVR